jgi:drug/metabolite transporter (DMT)-like permease
MVVALGVVVGFPLLTAFALQHVTSAHSIVFLGLLPLATAIFGVLRGGERPRPAFWIFSGLGSLLVTGFALSQDIAVSAVGDLLMLAAVVVCGLGYAEGARLTRVLGGWQVISWALIIALPLMLTVAVLTRPASFSGISEPAWFSLGYVSLFSMLIGFVFWYKGLAQGGIAAVGSYSFCNPFCTGAGSDVFTRVRQHHDDPGHYGGHCLRGRITQVCTLTGLSEHLCPGISAFFTAGGAVC